MKIINVSRHLAWMAVILLVASLPAFAKNSRKITFSSPIMLNATRLPAGEYEVRWEHHGSGATVTFRKDNRVVAAVQARLVHYNLEFTNHEVVYETNADRSRTVVEIRLEGMSEGIVLFRSHPSPFDSELESETLATVDEKPSD